MKPPAHELRGSVAAARVATYARASDLFFAHFEHHVHLEGPDEWRPDRPDLATSTGWRAGVLGEAKFRHSRLDRMVASFHPAHGPRWTAHELCHRLVGWAWRPGASPLWIATAARLAELVPVALWYFYDAGAPRCDRHALADPRFDIRCAACEALATRGPDPSPAARAEVDRLREEGDRFVTNELEAVRRTLRDGEYVPHRWATLELGSDGLAWAAAHSARLASPAFHAWVERFVPPDTGRHATLEALEARAVAVVAALRDGAELPAWKADRRRWIAQDIGWRLAVVQADCDPETAARIDTILDALANDLDAGAAAAAWRDLCDDVEVPDVEDTFAVGYDLGGGLGRSARQVRAGLATVCPAALGLLGAAADPVVAAFVADDTLVREPLGVRFARFLADGAAEPDDGPATANDLGAADPADLLDPVDVAELAALEAAVTHAPPMSPAVATLRGAPDPGGPLRLAPGVAVIAARRDWRGALGGARKRRPVALPPRAETHLAVVRAPSGNVALHALAPAVAEAVTTGGRLDATVDPATRAELVAAGVLAAPSRA